METGIRVLLLRHACKIAAVAGAALALQGCGLFGGAKEPPPLGAEVEPEVGPNASEQPVIDPQVTRRRIRESRIDTENFEIGALVGVLSIEDFGTSSVVGIRGAYHITEDFFLEISVGRSKGATTSYERLAGGPQLLPDKDRYFTYLPMLNIGWNALPGEIFIAKNQAYNSAFYFTGGMGFTKFAGDNRFTVNAGAGYRILLTDWLSVRFDFRDYLFDIDLLGEKKVAHNLEGSLGLSFFF